MRKAPARDASWGFLVAATWKLASVVGDAKKAKDFAQQRTGAFLLTFGDAAVRPNEAKAIRAKLASVFGKRKRTSDREA